MDPPSEQMKWIQSITNNTNILQTSKKIGDGRLCVQDRL